MRKSDKKMVSMRLSVAAQLKLARLVETRGAKSATALVEELILRAPLHLDLKGGKQVEPIKWDILPTAANPTIRETKAARKPDVTSPRGGKVDVETVEPVQPLVPRQPGKAPSVTRRQVIEKPDWKKRRDGEI